MDDGVCRVGTVAFRLVGADSNRGVLGWSLRGIPDGTTDVDGVPTTISSTSPRPPHVHPNGAVLVDHVVLLTPYLARTTAALAALGLEPRRERDGSLAGAPMRQVFYRLGEVILEVVGSPDATGNGPASLWGLTHLVEDIDASANLLGDRVGRVKDAVQPGRRITTLRHERCGMSVNTAFLSSAS